MATNEWLEICAESERLLIGAVMADPALYPSVGTLLPSEISDAALSRIFRAVVECAESGDDPDPLNVADRLSAAKQLANVGGLAYLRALAGKGRDRRVDELVWRLQRGARLRAVGETLARANQRFEAMNLDDADTASAQLVEILQQGAPPQPDKGVSNLTKAVAKNVERIRLVKESGERGETPKLPGVQTGIYSIDERWVAMEPGQLIFVGARPGMGKTAFAVNVGMNVAAASAKLVPYFSTEVMDDKIGARAITIRSGLPGRAVRTGKLTDTEVGLLLHSVRDMRQWSDRVPIDDRPGLTPVSLKRRLRLLSQQGELGLVIVDHMHQMRSSTPTKDDYSRFSDIADGLLEVAKEFRVPVMALAQLNRSLESRPNKRPMMADLRASGAIEQNADIVAFLYRDEVYDEKTEAKGVCEVITAKCREGAPGTDKLQFNAEQQRFTDPHAPTGW